MTTPFIKSPFGGLLGVSTASFYRLDKFGRPIAPIADINPTVTPDRVVLDMVDSESAPEEFEVTENPMQDFTSATSNVHILPRRIEVVGTLISSINLGLITSVGIGTLPGTPAPFRPDLQMLENLRVLARRREPIMYVSPRENLPLAFITRIDPPWSTEIGENTIVTVSLLEARIVNPLTAQAIVPDVASSFTGNNQKTGAGSQSGTPLETQDVQAPVAPGGAPNVVPQAA
jgi:hypothetical protein